MELKLDLERREDTAEEARDSERTMGSMACAPG